MLFHGCHMSSRYKWIYIYIYIYIYIQSYLSKNIYIQSQHVSVKMKNPNFQQSSNIYDFLVLISQNLWNFELQKCNTMRLSFPKHPVDITSASFFALLYMKQSCFHLHTITCSTIYQHEKVVPTLVLHVGLM